MHRAQNRIRTQQGYILASLRHTLLKLEEAGAGADISGMEFAF
jgi:hypothetical protein